MSDISYFQKFSQRENHATNNTLLVLRHLYRSSPLKFENLLLSLCDLDSDKLKIGPNFIQQIKESNSVPDGYIVQPSFAILIEAKTHGGIDIDQINRHCESIKKRTTKVETSILMTLTTDTLSGKNISACEKMANECGTIFIAKTFSEIVQGLKDQCADYEEELLEIIKDYEKFLIDSQLLYSKDENMVAVPCGTSYDENIKYGIYYDKEERSAKSGCLYLGIYKDKCVSAIGKIKARVICKIENDGVVLARTEYGNIDEDDKKNIKEIIMASTYYPNLKDTLHRYYILEDLHQTEFRKTTTGGMVGHRYFNIVNFGMNKEKITDTKNVAEFLKERSF